MKIRELMECVMQTGYPGMGTPEANKAGWGSGNYTSQRTGSWNGTAEDTSNTPKSKKVKKVKEAATSGATSSGSIATVANPQLSPGPARGKKSYTGTPGHSGTKAPPQPKPKNNTGKNALDMKGVSIFGQPIKR